MLTTVETRLTSQDEILARAQERLDRDRQRINLNVRARKRPSAHDTPIARDISGAGRPLPLAKYLDEREEADPSWGGVRKSLTPFFGMMMQVLKKRKLHEQGGEALYVEQNHRARLLYTETDRALMAEAVSAVVSVQSVRHAPWL